MNATRQQILNMPWVEATPIPATPVKHGLKIFCAHINPDGQPIITSWHDRRFVYEPGVEYVQRARPNHGGGYYFYNRSLSDIYRDIIRAGIFEAPETIAFGTVQAAGPFVAYPNNKWAASRLTVTSIDAVCFASPRPDYGRIPIWHKLSSCNYWLSQVYGLA
jgi:hypothetical protein